MWRRPIASNESATSDAEGAPMARRRTESACADVSRTGAVTETPEAQSPKRSSASTQSSRMAQSSLHCARSSSLSARGTDATEPADAACTLRRAVRPSPAPCRLCQRAWKSDTRSSAQSGSKGHWEDCCHDTASAAAAASSSAASASASSSSSPSAAPVSAAEAPSVFTPAAPPPTTVPSAMAALISSRGRLRPGADASAPAPMANGATPP